MSTTRPPRTTDPDAARHAIIFPPGLPLGFGLCARCHRLVAVEVWAGGERCQGENLTEESR